MNEDYKNRGMDLKRFTLYFQKKIWIILLLILGISLQLLTTCILRLIDTYRPELLISYHERVQRSFSINNGIIRI